MWKITEVFSHGDNNFLIKTALRRQTEESILTAHFGINFYFSVNKFSFFPPVSVESHYYGFHA